MATKTNKLAQALGIKKKAFVSGALTGAAINSELAGAGNRIEGYTRGVLPGLGIQHGAATGLAGGATTLGLRTALYAMLGKRLGMKKDLISLLGGAGVGAGMGGMLGSELNKAVLGPASYAAKQSKAKTSGVLDSAVNLGTIPLTAALFGGAINAARAPQGSRGEGALRGATTGLAAGMGGQLGLTTGAIGGGVTGALLGKLLSGRPNMSGNRLAVGLGAAGAIGGGLGGAYVGAKGLGNAAQSAMGPASYAKSEPKDKKTEKPKEESATKDEPAGDKESALKQACQNILARQLKPGK